MTHDVLQAWAVVLLQECLDLALLRSAEGGFIERQENLSKSQGTHHHHSTAETWTGKENI